MNRTEKELVTVQPLDHAGGASLVRVGLALEHLLVPLSEGDTISLLVYLRKNGLQWPSIGDRPPI